jgi:hypothetical protein
MWVEWMKSAVLQAEVVGMVRTLQGTPERCSSVMDGGRLVELMLLCLGGAGFPWRVALQACRGIADAAPVIGAVGCWVRGGELGEAPRTYLAACRGYLKEQEVTVRWMNAGLENESSLQL